MFAEAHFLEHYFSLFYNLTHIRSNVLSRPDTSCLQISVSVCKFCFAVRGKDLPLVIFVTSTFPLCNVIVISNDAFQLMKYLTHFHISNTIC